MFQPLDPLRIPIAQTNLIEASAGTGKTWSIAFLFTRLIVLEHYPVHQILVVTFTKAATAELKDRLRLRLDEALTALNETENAADNHSLLLEKCNHDGKLCDLLIQALAKEPQNRLKLRLKAAISEFDNAAIYTIHGFCQRVLRDFAFLCQIPFDIQLDETNLENQNLIFAQDFWRTRVAVNPILANLAYKYKLTPKNQLVELKSVLSRPYLSFRLPEQNTAQSPEKIWADFQAAWARISPQLGEIKRRMISISPYFKKNYYKPDMIAKTFETLQSNLQYPNPAEIQNVLYNDKKIIRLFTAETLEDRIKKENKEKVNQEDIQFISQLDELTDLADDSVAAEKTMLYQLSIDFTEYLREQQREFKKRSPQRVFDDLLLDVHAALTADSEQARELTRSLSQNWQVALIDEFQDTDPLQYAIFRTVFAQTETPLFLVGDPKQAIYHFRGADIFAYLQAAQESDQRYTLNQNYRSHRKLINSISALFQRDQPFRLPEIGYTEVSANRTDPHLLPAGHAVQIRWLPNEQNANKEALILHSAKICAVQIADLLAQSCSGSLKLAAKPNQPDSHRPAAASDIAVLVRRRSDGAVVQHELKRLGVQSVLLSRESVFTEPEAQAVAALLEFAIQPQKTGLLRFVLASILFEYDSAQLLELNAHESHLLAWIDSANELLECWQQHGIYAALQSFWQRHGVETRLLAQQNDRSITNLHQIMELLAQEDELSHTPAALLQWLGRQIQAASNRENGGDHHMLRLESDENLVKIVTMHASKGLEYPIVFCPFVWADSEISPHTKWFILHNPNGTAELISKDQYQQHDEDKQQIQAEHLSEDLRLLYVAMTRAQERLYLYVSHFRHPRTQSDEYKYDPKKAGKFKNALAYLLNADDNISTHPATYQQHWQNFIAENNAKGADFEWIVHNEQTFSGSLNPPDHSEKPIFRATEFKPRRFQFVSHTSFTALSRQTARAAEARADLLPALDDDERDLTAPPVAPAEACGIHAFAQGAAAGVCLHSILERFDWSKSSEQQIDLIDEKLTQHRFGADEWRDAVAQMCDFARKTPLLPRVNLATFKPNQMLSEMTFLLHIDDFRLPEIQKWFAQSDLPPEIIAASQYLNFHDVRGYISGAIDLVAQTAAGKTVVADYKSNALGNDAAAYTPESLNAAMAEHHYYLQAFIYAIAVARYLKSRHALPETIAIRYLFLRGLDGSSQNGVWAWNVKTADLANWID